MAKKSKREMDMARRSQGRQAMTRPQKVILAAAVASVLIAGAVFLVPRALEQSDCPGHWHASVGIYVDGERVRFPQPPYNYERDPVPGEHEVSLHMHAPDQEQLHFEPRVERCVGLRDTLEELGVRLTSTSITFEGAHEGQPYAGRHVEEGNKTLRVFLQLPTEHKREAEVRDVLDYQLRDGEKALILYGEYTDAQVEQWIAALKLPDGT